MASQAKNGDAALEGYLLYFASTSNKFHRERQLERIKQENPRIFSQLVKRLKEQKT